MWHNHKLPSYLVHSLTFLISISTLSFVSLVHAQASPPSNSGHNPADASEDSQKSIHLPLIFKPSEPPSPPPTSAPKILVCSSNSLNIPDNDPAGVTDTLTVADPRFIEDLEIRLNISHTWVGDLSIDLTHVESGRAIQLIDRPSPTGDDENTCGENNIQSILDDDTSLPAYRECASSPAAISGIYYPKEPLETFAMEAISGNWTLSLSDLDSGDSGNLNQWCIAATLNDAPVPPEPPPPPPEVPGNALIPGVTGQGQALPLDCESRSAVDWANYFGKSIGELEFFNNLPVSDNPDIGFVGDVYGGWGQIPPAPYGVHAEPIASLLKDYGLPAEAKRQMSWEALQAEIAGGRPVIVWIIGTPPTSNPLTNGIPQYYFPNDGLLTIVAAYEHTVIVTGYTANTVTFLNGANYYTMDQKQFKESWSALGNMAVIAQP
jgi:subtilisin-like proprotein convertase family protein/uncharacterized protein YvpB